MSDKREVLLQLPKGWIWTSVSEIGEVVTGTTPSKSEKAYYGNDFPLFKPTDLNSAFYVRKAKDGLSKKGAGKARLLPPKSILVTCIGATIGKVGFIRIEGASNQQINALVPNRNVLPEYLYFIAITPHFQKSILENASATTLPILNKSKFEILTLPLPPFPEQYRIVAEIEKQFTRLDAAVVALKRAQANLKRYRASVLKAACEGKLVPTEAELARDEGRDYEPADKLLERILKERRAKWEEDLLAKMRAAGKEPKDNKWRDKYKEPAAPDTGDLPELPEGWRWATVEQLSLQVQYGTSAKTSPEIFGVPVIRMGNIANGRLVLDDIKFLPKDHNEFPDLLLKAGDLLFNRTNSAELVGKTAVYRGVPNPCSFASYLIRVRLASKYLPDLLSYYINSVYGRAWIASVVSQQVGQANVNGTKLQALRVIFPPFAEQHRIVAEVERRLSVIDEIENTVEANLKRAERLRQSILKRTFEGKLVPQDPNDEPASVLLERIRAERVSHEVASKVNRKIRRVDRAVPRRRS